METIMNAIILAAGKSSRMYATGASVHKALLPIMGIPNIERTILMLHDINIFDIEIAVSASNQDFNYLVDKYSCNIKYIPVHIKNTLHTMTYLLDYINDTFIIEGDVVCARNIFFPLKSSIYYVIKYPFPEPDAWYPIVNSKGEITSFNIGTGDCPAIFGVSFWTGSSSVFLREHLRSRSTPNNFNNSELFWDDFIEEILEFIHIKTIEILPEEACEMNTFKEYLAAQSLCEQYLKNSQNFLEGLWIEQIINAKICQIKYTLDKKASVNWQKLLMAYYGAELSSDKEYSSSEIFKENELPYVLKDNYGLEYGYFSIVENMDFILLRRLIIGEKYRNKGLGSQVVQFVLTYAKLKAKELRVNIYNEKAEKFYIKIGFKKNFTNYHIM